MSRYGFEPLGDLVGGAFLPPEGEPLASHDPATEAGEVVLDTRVSADRVGMAAAAAAEAFPAWSGLSLDERWERLAGFRTALAERQELIAEAIRLETGKVIGEARAEAASLLGRFDAALKALQAHYRDGPVVPAEGESLEYRPLGVVGVIGPANYPAHLVHAYALPALLAGNTVVAKPSEVTPLVGQRYAEAAAAAGLPPGAVNVVLGGGAAGAALLADPNVRGLWFTGSYRTGQAIRRAAVDRPEMLLALELGGKNMAVVLDDADMRQAVHEIVVGGYLTTGQRCTATERVLVHASRRDELVEGLRRAAASLRFGDPRDPASFAGPLLTFAAQARYLAAVAAAREAGAEPLLPDAEVPAGAFVPPTLHLLPAGVHDLPGYLDEELFGPDLSIETFEAEDEALEIVAGNPFGFVASVFTASPERFRRFRDRAFFGMFNWNRSTNNASSNLPFGGMGRSGNFRPGGSHTPRSVTFPMAVLQNEHAALTPRPELAAALPPVDLDRLERRHAQEEREEAARSLVDAPRRRGIALPSSGRLPTSERWLRRLYAGERIVREKKPPVFDHLRSSGPWFVSVDDEPMVVLDAMSQTATLPAGFAPDEVMRAYVEGEFGDTVLYAGDTTATGHWAEAMYRRFLQERFPALPHVSFANGGAEANEKALALCHLHRREPAANRVLAFEGSFHGRTLLALHATYSPAKRTPYEVSGYEASYAPLPLSEAPDDGEEVDERRFLGLVAEGRWSELESEFADSGPLRLRHEIASLTAVARELAAGSVFACIVEPMQSEGGDRYASGRFYRALRLLTRRFDVPLIFDEVQTGFGLGGPLAWHDDYRLVDAAGAPDHPDVVTFAKRAQVGVVMSRFHDPEPTSVHPASLVRGLIYARAIDPDDALRVETETRTRLQALAQAFPDLVRAPRARGYAFAFDMPGPAELEALLAQRFWRGAIVFAAGDRTARYRLSRAFGTEEIALLFDAIRRSLAWILANPGRKAPAWQDLPRRSEPATEAVEFRVRRLETADEAVYLPRVLELEQRSYPQPMRDPSEKLAQAFRDPDGVALVAEASVDGAWVHAGHALAAPLELFGSLDGPAQDPFLGSGNTLYSLAVTVDERFRGTGLGRTLKREQLLAARETTTPDGAPRFHFVSGRNAVGHAEAMREINHGFGAHVVAVHSNQYPPLRASAAYYRIPLRGAAPTDLGYLEEDVVDLRDGVARPLREAPASLVAAARAGLLAGPTVTKLTLCNYVTPAVVRATEWIGALAPRLPHLYLTSSRDETVDKSLRILRHGRRGAQVAIGLDGGYFGHTTAAARSLSDPRVHAQGEPFFAWPRVPHPQVVGPEASIAAIEEEIANAGGPDGVLGVYLELVQERTGRVTPPRFLELLAELRDRTGVPVVVSETVTASYRSGLGAPFASEALGFVPDVLVWWPGGQLGLVHVSPDLRVAQPLAMVSTWDGDELSLVRLHHQLRALRRLDTRAAAARFESALTAAVGSRADVLGLGLYRVLAAGDRAEALARGLREAGILVRAYRDGALALAPAWDDLDRAGTVLADALPGLLDRLAAEGDPARGPA